MAQPYGAFGEPPLERPNWFEGRPVTAAGLDEQQALFRERMRRRNRLLHGWGVVRGLGVTAGDSTTMQVEPGFALDPAGNEIIVAEPVRLEARDAGVDLPGHSYWLALRWDEVPSGSHSRELVDFPLMTPSWREDADVAVLKDAPVTDAAEAARAAAPWVVLATVVWDGDGALTVDESVRQVLPPTRPLR